LRWNWHSPDNAVCINQLVAEGIKSMTSSKQPAGRKPATKFPQLRKKMEQIKLRAKVRTQNVRKSGHR
jgi:hypothetical protein